MGVLNQDQHWSLRRHDFQLAQQRTEDHRSLLLWTALHHRIAVVRRHRQEIGHQRQIAWGIIGHRLEQDLELVELRCRIVAWLKARAALELRNERVEWTI